MSRSMTGYALEQGKVGEQSWTVEIRSVNHRFLDLGLRVPNQLNAYENDIRQIVSGQLSRGKVLLSVGAPQQTSGKSLVNESIVGPLLVSLSKVQRKHKIPGDVAIQDLMRAPGFFLSDDKKAFSKSEWNTFKKLLTSAVKKLIVARKKEGRILKFDLLGRNNAVNQLLTRIEKKKQTVISQHAKRLQERIAQFAGENNLDDERLMKEVAISLEKMDITEEIVRLKAHLGLFRDTIQKNEICGKDLDFIVQEMNRETNTIASKVQNKDIGHLAIKIKAEIEKMREQLQNLE